MYDHPKIFKEALPALASSLTASGIKYRYVVAIDQYSFGHAATAHVELCVGMGVELGTKPFGIGGHYALFLALCALSLRSTTSQITAAMSGPPNAATCLMPVGEVTLISVR